MRNGPVEQLRVVLYSDPGKHPSVEVGRSRSQSVAVGRSPSVAGFITNYDGLGRCLITSQPRLSPSKPV
ncbi:uncharacterized protein YALI1_E12780g [Yarrowia lipolytica]|uniref:Uncharacterized protein n=1 Tax=Yarrowia lipolytica TaxID=4952 RepID=A0A1D8NHV6_YARLL|nr:hypothetical protein YALI1_E12780g [Yarrowia lipolytica]